jgi:23S rRNA pseudouridine2457 synthase
VNVGEPLVRYRRSVRDSWIERRSPKPWAAKSVAGGYPMLRLVRWRTGGWEIGELAVGERREIVPSA